MKKQILFFLIPIFILFCSLDVYAGSNRLTESENRIVDILLSEQIYWGVNNKEVQKYSENFNGNKSALRFKLCRKHCESGLTMISLEQILESNAENGFQPIWFAMDKNGKFRGYPVQREEKVLRVDTPVDVILNVPANYRKTFLDEWKKVNTPENIELVKKSCQKLQDNAEYHKSKNAENAEGDDSACVWWIGPFSEYSSEIHILKIDENGKSFFYNQERNNLNKQDSGTALRSTDPGFVLMSAIAETARNRSSELDNNANADDMAFALVKSPEPIDADAIMALDNYSLSLRYCQKYFFNFLHDGRMIKTLPGNAVNSHFSEILK